MNIQSARLRRKSLSDQDLVVANDGIIESFMMEVDRLGVEQRR